jgi:hypothetical protein
VGFPIINWKTTCVFFSYVCHTSYFLTWLEVTSFPSRTNYWPRLFVCCFLVIRFYYLKFKIYWLMQDGNNLKSFWYGKYGWKVSWIVKIYGKYGSKVSWIVKWYEKYGRKVSWIVKIWNVCCFLVIRFYYLKFKIYWLMQDGNNLK